MPEKFENPSAENKEGEGRFIDEDTYLYNGDLLYTRGGVPPSFASVVQVDPETLEPDTDPETGNVTYAGGVYTVEGLPLAIRDWAERKERSK